jgi:hypothetical protein
VKRLLVDLLLVEHPPLKRFPAEHPPADHLPVEYRLAGRHLVERRMTQRASRDDLARMR